MSKKLWLLFGFIIWFLIGCPKIAAQTTVNGNVTDAGSQAWFGGTWSVKLIPLPGNPTPSQYFIGGSSTVVPNQSVSGNLDASANFTQVLYPNTQISPEKSTWQFIVCPQATAACFTQNIQIPPSPVFALNFVPPAISVDMSNTIGPRWAAYADAEAANAKPGQYYWNVTNNDARICQTSPCSGANWVNFGGAASNPCVTTANAVQYNQSNSFGCAQGITTPDGNSLTIKGPDPYVDVNATGARAVAASFGTTASCSGTTSISVASATGFVKGDGIVVYGCGASETMSTPSAPTVTPGVTNTLTVPDAVLTTDTSGSTIYLYKIVSRDKFGGLTLPSNATTITNGPATLGENQLTVSTLSLSGNTLTVVMSATEVLKAGELIHIIGTTNEVFHLWATITSITNGTTFVINNFPIYSAGGISATGGTLTYYTGNQLTWTNSGTTPWQTIVCASRPADSGAYHVIGLTWPVNTATAYGSNTTFTDWGATLTSKPRLPSYIADSICTAVSATNDYLSTTITNISGNTFTLANTASQTASGQTALQDSAPGITAAFTYAAVANISPVLISAPPGSGIYFINSFLDLSSFSNIPLRQEGSIQLDETMIPPSRWTGITAGHTSSPSNYGLSVVNVGVNGAWPAIYTNNNTPLMENLSFQNAGNQALLVFLDGGGGQIQGGILDKLVLVTGSSPNDYTGMGLVIRAAPFFQSIKNIVFLNGPGNGGGNADTTWTPELYFARNNSGSGVLGVNYDKLDNLQFNGRTFYAVDGGPYEIHNVYTQGNILPTVVLQEVTGNSVPTVTLTGILTNDTSGEAILALLGGASGSVHLEGVSGLSAAGGGAGVPPQLTGNAPRSIFYLNDTGSLVGPGAGAGQSNSTPIDALRNSIQFDSQSYYANDYQDTTVFNSNRAIQQNAGPVSSNSGMFVPLATPVLSVPTPSAGGSIPDGAHIWCVNAVGFSGGWSKSSCQSFTTVGTNQTLAFSWTAVSGAASYVLSKDQTQCLPDANATCGTFTTAAGTTTFTYSGAGSTNGIPTAKTAAGDGSNGFNSKGLFGFQFSCPETTAPTGVATFDLLYCDSTAHAMKEIKGAGSASQVATYADFASPPAIGNTTPSSVNATTLTANDTGPFGGAATITPVACETSFAATTVNTGSATTTTGLSCVPANAMIFDVVYRITTTITTAASFTIGISGSTSKFCSTQSTLTAGTTGHCNLQVNAGAAESGSSAVPVVVTFNTTPGAGAMRIEVIALTTIPPTS